MSTIGIINYGMGNIASVKNAIHYIGFKPIIIENPSKLNSVDKLILPGVGAFGMAMANLTKYGFVEALNETIIVRKKNILGLCLGMQLFFESSEEHGLNNGLGWIEGNVINIQSEVKDLTVPHMGWNTVEKKNTPLLLNSIPDTELNFYFVHSYYCKCKNAENAEGIVKYGVSMDVIVKKDNIFGCQFHPEKSQKSGLQLLKNYCEC